MGKNVRESPEAPEEEEEDPYQVHRWGGGVLTWNVWEHLEDHPMIWYMVNNHGDCMSPKDRLKIS